MSSTETEDVTVSEYALDLGRRLRNVRRQQGLSLHDVEESSDGDLKASVVGAYERGERAVSVARLRSLAQFFRVPMSQLLPARDEAAPPPRSLRGGGIRIDLTRLPYAHGDHLETIERYVTTIQQRRGDYNGRLLTIRSTDMQTLAAVLAMEPDTLRDRLIGDGVAVALDE